MGDAGETVYPQKLKVVSRTLSVKASMCSLDNLDSAEGREELEDGITPTNPVWHLFSGIRVEMLPDISDRCEPARRVLYAYERLSPIYTRCKRLMHNMNNNACSVPSHTSSDTH